MTLIVKNEDAFGRPQEEGTLGPSAGDWENRYFNLIFIGVDRKGDFFFINKPENIYEFRWDRWSEWKKILQPFSFHCFMVEGYKTKTASSHGFYPVKHVAEFPGIKMARMFNKAYLERWQQFHNGSVEEITDETRDFVRRMDNYFHEVMPSFFDFLQENTQEHFANEFTKEQFAWAMSVHNSPNEFKIEEHLDNAEWIADYHEWLENNA